MTNQTPNLTEYGLDYTRRLNAAMENADWPAIEKLGAALFDAWQNKSRVFVCGNGGSAGNAAHIANDFIYGIGKTLGKGLNIQALTVNPSVMTCLANDEGYEHIFSHQLKIHAQKGDVLLVLSGSGNSGNVVEALKAGNDMGLNTFAILGYSGGKAKDLAQTPIHFPIDDMQISEDVQVVICHLLMQWMYSRKGEVL